MSVLLVALLLAPAVGALAVSVVPARARDLGTVVAATVALGWAVVAASDEPVTAGELVADPFLAAAAAGLALLVLASRTATGTGVAAGLLALTALPGAAALDPARLPDRRLAAGVVALGVLAAVRLLAERGTRSGQPVVLAAALVIASGLIGQDPGEAVALAAAGTLVAVVATAVWGSPGRFLVPAGLLALVRAAELRDPDPDLDLVLVAVAAVMLAGAGVLVLVRDRPVAHRLPLAGAVAAAGLLALDVPDLRGAGALLGAGAVLAVAGRHPAALVALTPGAVAAVESAGLATEPEHALVGAAVLAALVAGASGRLDLRPGPDGAAAPGPLTAAAVGFALVPLWGWSGADTAPYGQGVAVAVAVALPALILSGAAAGTIVRRPRAEPTHGSAPLAEVLAEARPQEEAGHRAP